MKSSLKINPILVIIAVVIGGAYMGIVGMFLAVPIAVIIKQILLEYMASSENENNNSGGILDIVVEDVSAVIDKIEDAVENLETNDSKKGKKK